MSAELVAIELQLKGYEGVMSDMRTLDTMLNGLRGSKNKILIESNLAEAKKDVIAYSSEIEKLKKQLAGTSRGHHEGNSWIRNPEWGELNSKLREAQENLKNARQRVTEFQYALRNFSATSFMQTFNRISSVVAHVGSAMQSAGNALTKMTNPFMNFTKGMVMGAGYQALNKFTSGLSSAFDRADTMRKYPKLMAEYSTATYTAEQSIKDLDKSVTGLPIALDDAVSLAQRYTLSLGDMERGTQLAIATNNAFLASMSSESQRYQGMMQMQDLLNGKDLNSREWMSLGSSMGKAINEIGKEFGYTNENMGEFRQELYAGNIATEDFLNALQKVGTGEGSLVALAQESMDTWEAFFSRISTAASRFGYGIIKSLDEIVTSATQGKFTSLNTLLDDQIIPSIDKMSESVQNWIKAHPDEIVDFFKSLKSIDLGSILKGVGEAAQNIAGLVKGISDMFGGKDLSIIGKFMVYGNILGKALTISGGLLKSSRHLIGGSGATIATIVRAVKGVKKYGLAGWLGMWVVGEDSTEATEAMETVAKVSPKMGKFSTGLSSIFKGWAQIATMIGGSAFVAWGSMKLFKNTAKTFGEMVDIIKDIDWDVGAKAIAGMAGFLGGMATLSGIAGHFASQSGTLLLGELVVGVFTTLATGFAALDMHFVKSSLKSFADSIKYLKAGLKELEDVKDIGADTGVADKIGKAIEAFNQVTTLFRGDFNVDTKQWENGLKHFDKDFADSLKGLKDALKSIADIANLQIDTSKLGNIEKQVSPALTSIGSMLEALPEGLGTKGTSDSTNNLKSIISNLKSAFADLNGDNGILAQIPKINEAVKAMTADPELNAFNDFKVITKQIGDALSEAYVNLSGGLRGNGETLTLMQNAVKAVEQAKTLIGQINSIAGMEVKSQGFTNISSALEGIKNAFDTDGIAEIKSAIDNCVQSIKDALAAFEELNQTIEIDVKFKLSRSFYSTRDSVIKEIKDAKSKIKAQQSGISLSIGVSVIFSVVSNFASALANITRQKQALERATTGSSTPITNPIGQSSGGYVRPQYRAFGGEIFKPRGTDTVPAMLTEGEYVQNQHATKFWGLDFMRKVNAMDVRGAMQAMLTRAGNSTNIGRQSIVNNTVNNNQRVTQHIQTNNPSFAKMRAGRFAGAL